MTARARVAVRDEGRGISAAFLPHVFAPYHQEDSSLTRAHDGLGLGLAIVKQIVDLHEGSVRAESAGENRGATFTIDLPALDAPANARPTAAAGAGDVSGLRVLVVDDDALLRDGLATALEYRGARATAVGSAHEALAALSRERFDVLVCDLAMPGQDGYALLRELRARPASEGGATPAVALSGQAREEDGARAFEAGFQEYLAKPVAPGYLLMAVGRAARQG